MIGADSNSEDSAASDPPPLDEDEGMPVASQALARARANARARGYRPGQAGRVPGTASGLGRKRGLDPQAQSRRDPAALGDEVQALIAGRGWDADVQVGSVVGRWPVIVGDQVASHVEPVSFEGTVLTVRADSTAWATQMKLLTHSILTRIETEVGTDIVTDIVVHAPGGPSWRKGPLRAPGRGPRDTYG
ncbi:MAG: DciA family protein [Ornithinimicrobium sp.]